MTPGKPLDNTPETGPTADYHRLLVEETPDALIVTSPEGEIRHWNPGAQRTFGYTLAEARGRRLHELITPPDRIAEEQRVQDEALQSGLSTYESYRRHRDGSLVYVNISVRAVCDARGEIQCLVINKKDVTHLKAWRDSKLLEARYSNLLESTPDAIIMANTNGRIVLVNSQAEALFGWSRTELVGKPIEMLLPERYRRAHVGHRSHYFAQPRTRSMGAGLELHGLRSNGEEFPVEISLSPLRTEWGTLVMSAIRDITDRKRVEQELQEKNEELANANSAKDTFLATMSHELRTPLNAIIGFTGTLLMKLAGPLNAEQEKQLGLIKGSARHLLDLINDLLDLARIGAGKLELNIEPVDCCAVVGDVVDTLRQSAEAKGLQLKLALPDTPVHIIADRRALSQIIINLASNAIKFTDQGRIDISLRPPDADDPHVEIAVRDTGSGIRREDQERLFTAFTQVSTTIVRRQEGTGLGLHLSQRLAQLLQGDIHCASEYGKGSTFTLRIKGFSS